MTSSGVATFVGKTIEWVIYIIAGLFIFVWFWSTGPMRVMEANVIGKRTRIQADLRSMATGIDRYYVDHNSLPLPAPMSRFVEDESELQSAAATQLKTVGGLTTPVAYLTSLYHDPFADLPFAYWIHGDWYVLAAPGPDEVFGLTTASLPAEAPLDDLKSFLNTRFAYDPTNGTRSSGDILRIENWKEGPKR